MPPKSHVSPKKKPKKTKRLVVKLGTADLLQFPPSQKRFNPLKAYNLQTPTVARSQSPSDPPLKNQKGKGKLLELSSDDEVPETKPEAALHDEGLWVDMYEPYTEAQLAIHTRKIEDVRRWLTEAFEGGKLRRYRRILALTGPSGVGKTATFRVLAREMGFKILEWQNTTGNPSSSYAKNYTPGFDENYESTFVKFEAFLNRATSCCSIISDTQSEPQDFPKPSTSSQHPPSVHLSKHIVLLEDLPNILHAQIQAKFHSTLRSLINANANSESDSPVPIVIIMSDATMRGETRDELLGTGGNGGGYAWSREKSDILDIRTVLPRDLLDGPYVTQIRFNPIAPTLMKKALTTLIDRHFKSPTSSYLSLSIAPTKATIDAIVESSNGDIRNAIMALQFSCTPGKRKKANSRSTALMEVITRRESSLALFHLIGRVMYNKRKGDPLPTSATTKDIKKEKELDVKLKDPPKLPPHLVEHERRASRVDIDSLYADSPIESSLLSLYIHQNYTQFCNELEDCDGVIDWLSWADSSGGEMWYQTNPHQFHLLTLGTLHSLPSPVPRRSQKVLKPEYFDNLSREKAAWEAVNETRSWMMIHRGLGSAEFLTPDTPRWNKLEVALELGTLLRLKQAQPGIPGPDSFPPSHSLFSRLVFKDGDGQRGRQMGEDDIADEDQLTIEDEMNAGLVKTPGDEDGAGGDWLESDDIEEF